MTMSRDEKNKWLNSNPIAKYRIRRHENSGDETRWVLEDWNPKTKAIIWTYDHYPTWVEAHAAYLSQVA